MMKNDVDEFKVVDTAENVLMHFVEEYDLQESFKEFLRGSTFQNMFEADMDIAFYDGYYHGRILDD